MSLALLPFSLLHFYHVALYFIGQVLLGLANW